MVTISYIIIKSIVFVVVYTFFHFAYDYLRWSIFAVSESVWEHLKIAYYATFFLAFFELVHWQIYGSEIPLQSFLLSRFVGALSIVPIIFLFFYFIYSVFGIVKNKGIKVLSVVLLTWAGGFFAYFIEAKTLHLPIAHTSQLLMVAALLASMLLFLFVRFTHEIPVYPVFEETTVKRD